MAFDPKNVPGGVPQLDSSSGRVAAAQAPDKSVYGVGGDQALSASDVGALSSAGLSGDYSANSNKLTDLADGASGSQDAASVAQVETLINSRVAKQVTTGAAGAGYLGHASIAEINALSPVRGDAVSVENNGTPTAGSSDALVVGDLAEYNGTSWKKIKSASGGFVPNGTRVLVATSSTLVTGGGLTSSQDEGKIASFDGTSNTPSSFSSPVDGMIVVVNGEGSTFENATFTFDGAVPTGAFTAAGGVGADHGLLAGLSDDDHTQYLKTDGTRALTGDQSFGSHKATGLAAGSADTDAATYGQARQMLLADGGATKTADFTAAWGTQYRIDASAGAVHVTMPASSANTIGRTIGFLRVDDVVANAVDITRAGSETLNDGSSTTVTALVTKGSSKFVRCYANGESWVN